MPGPRASRGIDVLREAAQVRERIGLAGQYAAVDENLTGFENLEMVGRLYHLGRRVSRERADELLAAFDLTDAGGRLVRTYSGGMRRRLDLAAALVARPPILFLDEPTTGLDIRSRMGLWDAIEALVAEGTTVLLTTQYLDEADRLADRIAVIDQGRRHRRGNLRRAQAQVGGDRLEIRLDDAVARGCRPRRALALSDCRPSLENGTVRIPLEHEPGEIARCGAAARRRRHRDRGHRRRASDPRRRLPEADRARGRAVRGGGAGGGDCGSPMSSLTYAVSDTLVLAKRSLYRIRRQPDLLVGFTIQPIMFVLLFVYVFGGAIATPGFDNYTDFLIPGIIVQSMVFGGFVTALGLAEDLKKGLIDRFRSLPMWGPAVLTGRILADVGTNAIQLVIMFAVGFAVGFRFSSGRAGGRRRDRPLSS